MTVGADAARLQHDALTWKAEAERLNTIVHEQRREIEKVRRESLAPVIRALLRVTAELKPFTGVMGPRVEAIRDDLDRVEKLANDTLRRMGL